MPVGNSKFRLDTKRVGPDNPQCVISAFSLRDGAFTRRLGVFQIGIVHLGNQWSLPSLRQKMMESAIRICDSVKHFRYDLALRFI